jgi:hypothetical protein
MGQFSAQTHAILHVKSGIFINPQREATRREVDHTAEL